MRNFEERKEEIFRRSQKRIAQRKKAVRRTVLACVPVVLCATVLSGYLVLGGFGKMDNAAPESAGMDYNYGMMADSVNRAECPEETPQLAPADPVALEIGSCRYTDGQTLVAFQQIMRLSVQEETDTAPEAVDNKGASGWVTPEQIIEGEPYPVAVTYADGTQVWYILRGNHLTRVDGQVQVLLTDAQAQWLYELMEGK